MEDGNGSETQVNFNRFATIGDMAGDNYNRACQIVCYEPNNSTGAINQSGNSKVWYILFVSKDKLKFYNGATNASNKIETKTIANNTDKNYLNRLLNEGYNSQNDIHIAKHFASTIVSDNFNGLLRRNLSFNTGRSKWSLTNLCSCSTYSPSYDSRYDYYGVFVYYGIGTSGQGRVMYKIVRKLREVPVTVNFKKTDMDGTSISGAQIKIECGDNAKFSGSTSTSTTKTVGSDTKVTIAPINYNLGSFKLKISETTAPTSHAKFSGTITVTVNYNTSNGTVTSITSDNTTYIPNISSNTVTIKNQYISPIVVGGDNGGFNKVDQAGNPISGAKFRAVFKQGSTTLATRDATSGSNGKLSFAQVQPTTTANVTVTITETSAPTGYVNSGFSKTIEFKYNTATKTWEPVNDSTVSVKYESKKTFVKLEDVVNESRIEELEILKQDSQNGSKLLSGAEFKITLENVKSVKGYSSSGSGTQVLNGVTTNTQGKIVLKEIVIKDAAQDVIVTIEETESPNGYKKIDGKIIIVITRTGTQYKIVRYKDNTVLDEEFVATVIDETGRVPGDVSGNGLVNSGDALLVLQYTMGLLDSSERAKVEENGDLNGDGRITSEDADLILQYSVGLVSSSSDSVYFEKIANGERGDADSDGQITANDALAVLKYSTDLAIPNNAQRTQSDVNEDGNVNSSDALIILKYLQYANGRVVEGENVTGHKISLTIKDIPGIQELVMNKADSQNRNPVAGAEFEVSFENVRSVNGTNYAAGTKIKTTTNADGHFYPTIEKIIPKDNNPIIIHITETKAPDTYKKIDGTITIKINVGTYSIQEITTTGRILPAEFQNGNVILNENNELVLNIANIPNIQELDLNKVDSQDETKVAGAVFEVNFGNVVSVGTQDADGNGNLTITKTTDSNGDFEGKIENIEIKDPTEPIVITIKEIQAPVGYKKIDGTITIEIELNTTTGTYSIVDTSETEKILPAEFQDGNVSIENNEVILNIGNIPVMNLGGIVWEDTQSGVKAIEGPNGEYDTSYKYVGDGNGDYEADENQENLRYVGDKNGSYIEVNEEGMGGIELTLYVKNGDSYIEYTMDKYKEDLRTMGLFVGDSYCMGYTASESTTIKYKNPHTFSEESIDIDVGEYVFPNLPKGDYMVKFTYDGIHYESVGIKSDYVSDNKSKAEEDSTDRNNFNERFTTIEEGKAIDETKLSYSIVEGEGNNTQIAKLNVNSDGSNPADPNNDFKMSAETNSYMNPEKADDWKNTWTELGKINEESYALDINCGLTERFFDLAIGNDINSATVSINGKDTIYGYNEILSGDLTKLELDKRTGKLSSKNENGNQVQYPLELYASDYNYIAERDYANDSRGGYANGYATDVTGGDVNLAEGDLNLKVYVTYKVILKNQSKVDDAYIKEIAYYFDKNFVSNTNNIKVGTGINEKGIASGDLSYEVDTDKFGKNVIIVDTSSFQLGSNESYRKDLYFTFEINKDSDAYKNLGTTNAEFTNCVEILSYTTSKGLIDQDSAPGNFDGENYEDDTDEAPGLLVTINANTREISGTVWDDTTGDDTTTVLTFNNANGYMENGEKKVKDVIVQLIEVKKIGDKYYEYIWQEEQTNDNGKYEFEGFIPGNYIIRFIYGNDFKGETDEVKTYNGQDYKSTIDLNYNKPWYNTAGYTSDGDGNYPSVARDNEARRLEVMSYSTTIDKDIGQALENKTSLDDTWMCAETSRINVPVDGDASTDASDYEDENGAYNETDVRVGLRWSENVVTFPNVNFGLALRPQTKLELEKHITGLKITPNGVGVQPIIDATADIGAILSGGETVATRGITTGLAAMKSDRDNRNFWKVETDIEELAQGAELEVEYTYVIKNVGDEDYLSSILVNAYQGHQTEGDGTMSDTELGMSYKDYLTNLKNNINTKGKTDKYGTYLGQWYYNKEVSGTDSEVLSTVDTLQEAVNEQLTAVDGGDFTIRDGTNKNYIDTDGTLINNGKEIKQIVTAGKSNDLVTRKDEEDLNNYADYSKKLKLTTVLSSSSNGEGGANLPSYIAEITQYSNAAGRRDMESEPENLSYVHSDDKNKTLNTYKDDNVYYQIKGDGIYRLNATVATEYEKTELIEIPASAIKINEPDEFWGESIIITKPTGENKQTGIQIAIITTSAVALLGVGIVLIKKFVLKK